MNTWLRFLCQVSASLWKLSWVGLELIPCHHVPTRSVEESFNMSDESGGPSLGVARKKKIAIGVIFMLSPNSEENSRFQDFFFSHFPLFESHMNKLKSAIEQVNLCVWVCLQTNNMSCWAKVVVIISCYHPVFIWIGTTYSNCFGTYCFDTRGLFLVMLFLSLSHSSP